MKYNEKNGFTLVELLLAVFILSVIALASIPAWMSFSDSVSLEDSAKLVETKIKLAKNYSLDSLNDSNYGIHFDANGVTVFTGSTYVFGNPGNQAFNLPGGVEIYGIALNGGGYDLVFGRLTGTTANDGTISVRIASHPSKTRQIFINAHGQTGIGAVPASSGALFTNARHVHFALGWNIQNATNLTLKWTNSLGVTLATNSISTAAYFNGDKSVFDWKGATLVNGVSQQIRIHSWLDAGNTILCVMRDQTETDTLNISFTDGVTKDIATYANNGGVITVTPNMFGGTMTIE